MPEAIEVVRGRMSVARADQVIRFLADHAGLDEGQARGALDQVVCVVEDGGEVAGVSAVRPVEIPLIGGRKFWVHRVNLRPGFDSTLPSLERTAYEVLNAEFEPGGNDPIGLCVLVTDPERMRAQPEPEWHDPRLLYAGYVDGNVQVRIAYFDGAKIGGTLGPSQGSATPMADPGDLPGYRIAPFADQDEVSEQDVLDLWAREGALSGEKARERLGELVMVARDESGELVGVSTARLRVNEQLWTEMWHYRVFVAAAHRRTHLAVALTLASREHLKERFVSGEDTRAAGIVMAIQSPVLLLLDDAIWKATDFAFIGQNAGGNPVRVHYFPGAVAPGPPQDA